MGRKLVFLCALFLSLAHVSIIAGGVEESADLHNENNVIDYRYDARVVKHPTGPLNDLYVYFIYQLESSIEIVYYEMVVIENNVSVVVEVAGRQIYVRTTSRDQIAEIRIVSAPDNGESNGDNNNNNESDNGIEDDNGNHESDNGTEDDNGNNESDNGTEDDNGNNESDNGTEDDNGNNGSDNGTEDDNGNNESDNGTEDDNGNNGGNGSTGNGNNGSGSGNGTNGGPGNNGNIDEETGPHYPESCDDLIGVECEDENGPGNGGNGGNGTLRLPVSGEENCDGIDSEVAITLPQTGSYPRNLFFILGAISGLSGLVIKKLNQVMSGQEHPTTKKKVESSA